MKHSRRQFLQRGALTGALWLPGAKQPSPSLPAEHIGKSKWDLDTPALCVDLDKMERNIAHVHNALRGTDVAVRPHVKTHKCPEIAKMQVAAGAVGICVAKLSEAEVMLENGIEDVLMTGVNVTPAKVKRAMALVKKHPRFIQATDHADNARDLQEAARAVGVTADVVIDVDVMKRSGVPADKALALAQQIDRAPNLRLRGLLAYDGGAQHIKGFKERREKTLANMEPAMETCARMKRAGLSTEIFSGGGTGTYNMMAEMPGFTDVQVGSYLFMDTQYIVIGGKTNEAEYDDFTPSLTVMTTVINNYHPSRLTTDSGAKALTINKPQPWVVGEPGFRYSAASDEYGSISFEEASRDYKIGDRLEVVVPHCDPVVNLYDFIYGIRGDKVERVFGVAARGCSV